MEWFRNSAFLIIGVVFGLLVGYFGKDLLKIELKKEVGLDEVFNFIVALVVAFLFQAYFQKRFGNKRAEKDHIIDLIKETVLYLKDARTVFNLCYEKKRITKDNEKEIKALLRNLINSVTQTKEVIIFCGYKNEESKCKEIESLYIDFKRALTGGNFPTKPYDGENFSDAETSYGKLTNAINQLRINLNRK